MDILGFLAWLLVVVLIVGIIFWLLDQIPQLAGVKAIARPIVAVIAILILLAVLLGGVPLPRWR